MQSPRTVVLHVGCRKSATSALQLAFRNGAAVLEEQGLAQPLVGRGSTTRELVEPLRLAAAGDPAPAREAVARLAERVRASEHRTHLVTLEALAEMPREATRVVLEGLAGLDTRVVVTARPWALTIPSEWQQRIKSRFTGGYLEYAAALRDPATVTEARAAEEAALFRRRQDLADVVERWSEPDGAGDGAGSSPAARVHVVLVPRDREASPDLLTLFCDVVGVDPSTLSVPGRVVNPSLTREDAEVLRRVNLALGDRLTDLRGDYRYSVRNWVAVAAMMRRPGAGGRIRLPRELEEWAAQESRRQVERVRELGAQVVGDLDGFVHPRLPGEDHVPVSDAEAADAAAVVIAELAARHDRKRRQENQDRRASTGKSGKSGKSGKRASKRAGKRLRRRARED